jgi:hypothetical protein
MRTAVEWARTAPWVIFFVVVGLLEAMLLAGVALA